MLTKSAAKAFFLGGTALCGLAFLLLTADTMASMPKRSNQEQMTEQVVRGHHIWNKNNCMGCHTLMGEGAYYAPELTKVVERRGEAWINLFLENPQSENFYQGRRKMIRYDIFNSEVVGPEVAAANKADIIAFLAWVGRIDTNGFPAKPDMTAPIPDPPNYARAPQKFKDVCTACHSVDGKGGNVGPALDGVFQRFPEEGYLRRWIANPQAIKPGTIMPVIELQGEELDAIVQYLESL
ncbi:MAG: c-type cytochrome [Planctomycetes bacterium]|nr:c-type cytochrome [Planctomycetota bacterium]